MIRILGIHYRYLRQSKINITQLQSRYYVIKAINKPVTLSKTTYKPAITTTHYRHISLSHTYYDKEPLKPSSKVEKTVEVIKKEIDGGEKPAKKEKKPLMVRIKEELNHYYHGFRLLGVEMRISTKLAFRLLKGEQLNRREHRLLVTTIGDMFRLVPFSVFIIVPFLEFTLPIFLKIFPGMLPSTFETKSQKDQKYRQHLKLKLEMAKFFQETLDEMAPQATDRHSQQAKDFACFFRRIRNSGEMATSDEILKFSKLFEDEITLDSLQRPQLVALCKILNVPSLGTSAMLRFNLRMKLRALAVDDKMIAKEGVDSLNLNELQQACVARGMRAYGVSEDRLRKELKNWLDLSLNEKVPQSLLLLSRVLMVPDHVPTSYKLQATISALPEQVVTQTKAAIGEKEGKLDFKAKLEAIKLEEQKIREELKEEKEAEEEKKILEEMKREHEFIKETAKILDPKMTPELVDMAPIISDKTTISSSSKDQGLTTKDVEIIEDAIVNISETKKSLLLEKERIDDLKQELSEYSEDVKELQEIVKNNKAKIKLTKGATRLYKVVNSMIGKMDKALIELETKEKKLKTELDTAPGENTVETKELLIQIDELMSSIKSLQKIPDENKLRLIQDILGRLDDDFDGQLKVEDVLKVVEVFGNDNVQLSEKQIAELIELLDKEEIIEVESKIQKALEKAENEPKTELEKAKKSLLDLIREAQERKHQKKISRETSDNNNINITKTKSDDTKSSRLEK